MHLGSSRLDRANRTSCNGLRVDFKFYILFADKTPGGTSVLSRFQETSLDLQAQDSISTREAGSWGAVTIMLVLGSSMLLRPHVTQVSEG